MSCCKPRIPQAEWDEIFERQAIELAEGERLFKEWHEMLDNKTKPNYYDAGQMDVIAFCFHHKLDFATGNIIKYLVRAGKKGDALEDLQKAKEYLDRLILNCTNDLVNEQECHKFDVIEELNKIKI